MDRPKKERVSGAGARGLRARGLRAVATLGLAGAMIAGAWPQCETHDDSGAVVTGNVGAEITVTVLGRGRVTSSLGDIDCPSRCFAGILLSDPGADGGPPGVTLTAESGEDSHFERWSLEPLTLGVRARGPSQCSPMMRSTSTVSFAETFELLLLRFGETTGTPPRGHEAECADFVRVPVAYALTAHFAENFHQPQPDAAIPPDRDILFEPVAGTTGPALDIGVVNARLYWRYKASEGDGNSGIATASTSKGATITTPVPPNQTIDMFDVDQQVVFQLGSGVLRVIEGGSTFAGTLGGAPLCAGVASDSTQVYCRYSPAAASSSTLYVWSLRTNPSSPSVVYALPRGGAFAVDEGAGKVYFGDEVNQYIVSAPRNIDGGSPTLTYLVSGQSSPRQIATSSSLVFWLDGQAGGSFTASSSSKLMTAIPQSAISGSSVRVISVDTTDPTVYWIGIDFAAQPGQATILRAQTSTTTTTTSVFRSGLDSLNGLANDFDYVYWTGNDGRVYRGVKGPEL